MKYFILFSMLPRYAASVHEKCANIEINPLNHSASNENPQDNHLGHFHFITTSDLKEFEKQINNSRDRFGGIYTSKESHLTFPDEVDLIFRMYYGLNTSEQVLKDSLLHGAIYNPIVRIDQKTSINQPFVNSLPSTVSSVQRFVNLVTNGTSKPGDVYFWSSGNIYDFNLTASRVRKIIAFCHEMSVDFSGHRTENITWFFYTSLLEESYRVFVFPSEHGSPLCYKGDSLIGRGHGAYSQPLLRVRSTHSEQSYLGPVSEQDLNPGNIRPRIFSFTANNRSSPFLRKLLKSYSGNYGLLAMEGTAQSMLVGAESAFEQELAMYNNVSFLILSLTGLVSSTILVVLTAKGASYREIILVIVEALVVVVFLFVVTYSLVVFTRADDYVVDYRVSQSTVHHFEGNITVRGSLQRLDAAVGKRFSLPKVLITTVVLANISTLVALGNIVRLFSKRRKRTRANHDDNDKNLAVSFAE